jgi:hypothetical protein
MAVVAPVKLNPTDIDTTLYHLEVLALSVSRKFVWQITLVPERNCGNDSLGTLLG